MKELIGIVMYLAVWGTLFMAWLNAIIHTAKNDMIFMLLVDLFLPPIGVIHGIILWLGG